MDTKDIKKEIEEAMRELETVTCITLNRAVQTASNKKVHRAYDILFELNKRL